MLTSRAVSPVFVFERSGIVSHTEWTCGCCRCDTKTLTREDLLSGSACPDELTLPYAAARQLCCFPVHRHANSRAATGMIEKDEFLQRGRLHFTIFPELQRDHRCGVRLTRGIQSEDIRFTLDRADHRVRDRRQQEGVSGENQHQQWESGRIRNSVHTPARAAFLNDAIEY